MNFSKSILFLILEHFKILKNEMQCIHLTVRLNFVFWDIKAPITFIVITVYNNTTVYLSSGNHPSVQ